MSDKTDADETTFADETYPNLEGDLAANATTVLEQYRQGVISRNPLSLEWLFDSLKEGYPKDAYDYNEGLRTERAEHTAAIEAAGGPFDASYNPPPVIVGEEGTPLPEATPGPPSVAEVEVAKAAEATAAATRLAEELGVDLHDVEGTGADGKVVVGDVKDAAKE